MPTTIGRQPKTGDDVSFLAGEVIVQWEQACTKVTEFQEFLARTTDQVLGTAPYGFTPDQISSLRSAFGALETVVSEYEASYRTFPAQLVGMGAHQ